MIEEITGSIVELREKDFIMSGNYLDISSLGPSQYVPFTEKGIKIKYGFIKNISKMMNTTEQDAMEEFLNKRIKVIVEVVKMNLHSSDKVGLLEVSSNTIVLRLKKIEII